MRKENSWSKFTQHPEFKWFCVYLNQTANKNNQILNSFEAMLDNNNVTRESFKHDYL